MRLDQITATPAAGADWLAGMLRQLSAEGPSIDLAARLHTVPFTDLLTALETVASKLDHGVAVQLYRAWIAANPGARPYLSPAWFNLGVEAARIGDRTGAALAYQTALALKPEFHPAAVNLGLMQEAEGQPAAALATWTQALQPDEARTALLNQRARLL